MAYGQTLVSILLEPQLRVSTHSVFFSTQITSDMVKSERNSPERRWRNIRLLPECPRKVRCTVEAERVHQMEEVLYKKGVLHESAEE